MTVSFKISFLNGHARLFELLLFSRHAAILSIPHLFIMHVYRISIFQPVMRMILLSNFQLSTF